MKLQKLTIHNLASIRDAEIDFESEPLSNSDVFLITGKTGAGKSTLLDAICLALYADTPRLDNSSMDGKLDREKDDEMSIKDPRQLLTRNTGEGFAKLSFTGNNQVHYEATWTVNRSHNKAGGSLQKKKWMLTNLDRNITYSRDSEIKPEIQAAIGLDFSQFCRTTVLAQGEFTRFLNSNDKDKAAILEKITGVDIYSKIGAKIHSETSNREKLWNESKSKIEFLQTLSNDEVTEKKCAIADIEKQQEMLAAQTRLQETKCNWLRTDLSINKEYENALSLKKTAQDAIDSIEYKQQSTLVDQWDASIQARGWMREIDSFGQKQTQQQKELLALEKQYIQILEGQRFDEQELQKMCDEGKNIEQFLSEEKANESVYQNVQAISGHITTIVQGRKILALNNDTVGKETDTLIKTLTPAHDEITVKLQNARKELEQCEEECRELERELTELHLSDLRQQKDKETTLLSRIASAQERIVALEQQKNRKEDVGKQLELQMQTIQKLQQSIADLEPKIPLAQGKVQCMQELFEKHKDSVDKFAKTIRLTLHKGDTCPVCQQKLQHELPVEDELERWVAIQKEALDKATQELDELVNRQRNLSAEMKAQTTSYDSNKKAYDQDQSVVQAELAVQFACKECNIEWNEKTSELLETIKRSTENKIDQLKKQLQKGESLEQTAKEKRTLRDSKQKIVNDCIGQEQKAVQAMNVCKSKIQAAQAVIQEKMKDVQLAQNTIEQLLGRTAWLNLWKKDSVNIEQRLIASAEKFNDFQQKRNKLENWQKEARANIDSLSALISAICQTYPSWQNIQSQKAVQIPGLFNKAQQLSQNLTALLTQIQEASKMEKDNRQRLEQFLKETPSLSADNLKAIDKYSDQEISNIKQSIQKRKDELTKADTTLETIRKQKGEHLNQKPQGLKEDDTIVSLETVISENKHQMNHLAESKGAIVKELETDEKNRQTVAVLISEAEKRKADYLKWQRLNQFIGDSKGDTFRKIAQSYILSSLIYSANSYMRTLSNRYKLTVTPGTFIISVEDAYQGYISRPASGISGGESFLVSLSLALALSDISQRLSVDTLFIDEGFGTLSGEPLQNAISTLRFLHTKAGRHVGIISHMEELKEQITVQIQVNQEGTNSFSEVNVVG